MGIQHNRFVLYLSHMAPVLNTLDTLKHHGITQADWRMPDGALLSLHEVVRLVPKRRLVCRATWQQQAVYAKLFVGKSHARYAARDARGVQCLTQAGILTPPLLHQAQLVSPETSVLIYQAIADSQNAKIAYAQASPNQRVALLMQLMQTLAAHHQVGVLQTDIYLSNFLVAGERIYTIDGDAIRQSTRLTHRQALGNVAKLLSNVDVMELEQHLPDWLHAYATARQWASPPRLSQMQAKIARSRAQVLTTYADKKVFRTCTDVTVQEDEEQFTAYSNAFFEVVKPLNAEGIESLLNTSRPLKNGNTCTVGLTELQGQHVVVKRYNIKGFWHGIGRALRKSRAAISWANAHRLKLLGISTPQPVALIEQKRISILGIALKGKSYFLSAYMHVPDVAVFFSQTTDKALRAEAVKQLTMLLYRFYLLKLSHGDMKATNIKMQDTTPMLIDLDSMQQHRWAYFAQQAHVRDLQRFMQNWKHDTSLYNAFIKSFKVVYADHTPLQQANILSD